MELSIDAVDIGQSVIDSRAQSVLEVLAGRPLDVVAAEHQTSPSVLRRWVTQFVNAGNRALSTRAVADDSTVDHLLTVIAHEIRSPLTSAAMGLRLLSDDRVDAERRGQIGTTIAHELDVLAQLADDVLDGASVALGQMQLTVETVDVVALIADAVAAIDDDRLVIDRDGECLISADPRRLWQIAVNLLHNALRHGVDDIAVDIVEQGVAAILTVTNHARERVSMEAAHSWFEPFARGSSRTGHGLGLYVVRALTVAHAGISGVDSLTCTECESGQDLKFWISLPVAGPPTVEPPAVMSPALPTQRRSRHRDRHDEEN